MDFLVVLAAVLGAPAVTACLWYWTSRRGSAGRGATAGLLGIVDEVFRPETHQAQEIQKSQHELSAPAPAPGDPNKPYSGTIRLPEGGS
jgi:hypothetical protein